MALSQPDTRALQAYNKWRSEALVECKDITSDSHALLDAFIPKSQVEHFFEDEYRLKQLLLRHVRYEKCETVCRSIRRSYSRVYCILLDIRRPQLIEQFTEHHELRDEMLPFSKRPSPFPNTSNDPEVWSDFYKKQRVYCPITLEDEEWMQHPAEQVLPFTSMKRLKVTGSTADLYCAEIHKEYDGLESHEQATQSNLNRKVALKVYRSTCDLRTITYAKQEAENFGIIRNRRGAPGSEGLVEFHCAYFHNGESHLLMEFADEGTLEGLYWNNEPPSTGAQIIAFWTSLVRIIRGLVCVHDVEFDPNDEHGTKPMQGWHQDVKPSNILAFSNRVEGEYKCDFKLADLGISHFHIVAYRGETGEATDQQGTSTYGAPEVYRPSRFYNRSRIRATNKIDIFSAGCVLLEAAVWVVHGKTGLQNFRNARSRENKKNKTDAGDCFHDGRGILEVVVAQRESLAQDVRVSDYITTPVLDTIARMLRPGPNHRPTADVVAKDLEDRIDEAERAFQGHYNYDTDVAGKGLRGPSRRMITRDRTKSMGDPPSNSTSQTEPTSGSIGPSSESQGGILGTTGLVEEPYGPVSPFPSNPDTVPSKTTSNTTSGEYRRTNNLANLPWNGDATESPKTPSRMSPVMNPDTPRSPRDHSPSMFTELPARSHERRNSIPDSQSAPVQSPSKSASAHVSQEALPTQEKIPPAQKPRPVNDTTSREIPYASLEQMITWQAKCESKIRRHFMKHPPESPPQGYLMSRLQNRDHVFIIDNAVSMSEHWSDVHNLLGPLSYLLKACDPDGVEFYWTIGDSTTIKYKTPAKMQAAVNEKQAHRLQKTNISIRLGLVLETYRQKLLSRNYPLLERPMNIYILTDGIWADGGDAETPITQMVEDLKRLGFRRRQVGIQFISFGNDSNALRRLELLDLLGKRPGIGMDIVDTEPHDGNVWKMLLGAIYERFDADAATPAP